MPSGTACCSGLAPEGPRESFFRAFCDFGFVGHAVAVMLPSAPSAAELPGSGAAEVEPSKVGGYAKTNCWTCVPPCIRKPLTDRSCPGLMTEEDPVFCPSTLTWTQMRSCHTFLSLIVKAEPGCATTNLPGGSECVRSGAPPMQTDSSRGAPLMAERVRAESRPLRCVHASCAHDG